MRYTTQVYAFIKNKNNVNTLRDAFILHLKRENAKQRYRFTNASLPGEMKFNEKKRRS